MKKNIYHLSVLIAGVVLLAVSGCKKDNEAPKSGISLIDLSDASDVYVGQQLKIRVNVRAETGIKDINVTEMLGEDFELPLEGYPLIEGFESMNQHNFEINYTVPHIEQAVVLQFYLTDMGGEVYRKAHTLNILGEQPAGGIKRLEEIVLGNQANEDRGSFWSVSSESNTAFKLADGKQRAAVIDMCFFFSLDFGPTLASPDDVDAIHVFKDDQSGLATWPERNATRFAITDISSEDFDQIENDVLIEAWAPRADQTKVADLFLEEVFVFVTAQGKKGLGRVNEITGTDVSTGVLKFDVIISD